ncbi:esterase/lipase family protein [Burkholderia territorii]|uniref:esterase/lipase family protein n=1 Tax=Burkholderia territorii TaxID=1503055 RepID=UPI000A4FA88A|nr:hypothetical protein [Burkholderia territorii]
MAELKRIHESESEGRPNVIFIHGLNGHVEETWMHNTKDHTTLWPRWVGEDFDCSVWVLGYDAALSGWSGGAMPLLSQGTSVLDRITSEPGLSGQKLVLVGHSLGGLVVKSVIVNAETYGVKPNQDFLKQVAGVVFVATPHFGSDIANIAMASGPLKHALQINRQVGDLQARNEQLRQLNYQFRAAQAKYRFHVRSYFETQEVCFPRWFKYIPRVPVAMVVLPESAEPHVPSTVAIPLDADHFSIAKPVNRSAQIHVSLKQFLAGVVETRSVDAGAHASSDKTSDVHASGVEHMNAESKTKLASEDMPVGALVKQPRLAQVAVGEYGLYREQDGFAVTAFVVTDSPSSLIDEISSWRQTVARDPLVPMALRSSVHAMDLRTLFVQPQTRTLLLSRLAVTPFSGYVYYASVDSLSSMGEGYVERAFFVEPLVHRMSKKTEVIEKVLLGHEENQVAAVAQAKTSVATRFGRAVPAQPVLASADRRGAFLVELANLVAYAVAHYLAERPSAGDTTLLAHLRTRIRFAQNVVTGEKHKRDENPL